MPQSEAQMVQWIETTAALWTEHFNCLLIHKIPVLQTWVYYYIDKENTTDNTQKHEQKNKASIGRKQQQNKRPLRSN